MSRESTDSQRLAALKSRVLAGRPASDSDLGFDVMSVEDQNQKQRASDFVDLCQNCLPN